MAMRSAINDICNQWPKVNSNIPHVNQFLQARSVTTFKKLPQETREKMQNHGCPICRNNIKNFGYKDVLLLKQFISDEGRIYGKRKTGLCAKQHRKVLKAIKRSRAEGLLPNYKAPTLTEVDEEANNE
ncbi:uncharacterized protein TRIADDRAFT_53948 [Trichoplax adhaerens]|uniref:28S ribosomal protein S18a, mitochondrial n=1 Tax=Trichoplax adhaerens TaxID=10228 RepID=B3RMG7_TRIAD|nr:hypothetical protein TRIADDRAFT_53948 [Trichoplax adhaerens]EDV28361.1 hypothetical protein TRIADDRAFT_53948 [Trichoplax adhaerens]|eukprot:XP_002110195.1 hypothetical protein TRIADDRAFT_53948 [Trichoplax adhaerens]